ncbi:MAG: hypothetical protein HY901_12375 [Deltaproteobacteria bacterium]|nr:hypothetical protein [Deltaproteobacteria bacterium]
MKFLVLWELELARLSTPMVAAVMRMPEYARGLARQGKLERRYHVVGRHGGAWLYEVDSNEELERLLAAAPVYNFARHEVLALAEMEGPQEIVQPGEVEKPAPRQQRARR